jgi:hypothetical protein
MPRTRGFDFGAARAVIAEALIEAGYDVIDDPAEPNLIRARRDAPGQMASVAVDAGGRMRLTRVRQLGPEEAGERRLASRHTARMVRRTDETLIVLLQLRPADTQDFAALLAELENTE